jgi:hypothetical protein
MIASWTPGHSSSKNVLAFISIFRLISFGEEKTTAHLPEPNHPKKKTYY